MGGSAGRFGAPQINEGACSPLCEPTPSNPPHCPLTCLIMCLTTTELPPEQRGPSGGMRSMIAPSVPRAPTGGGWSARADCACARAGRGWGGSVWPTSAGAWRKGIPVAGADAKLAATESLFNYCRLRGLFYLRIIGDRFRWSSEPSSRRYQAGSCWGGETPASLIETGMLRIS